MIYLESEIFDFEVIKILGHNKLTNTHKQHKHTYTTQSYKRIHILHSHTQPHSHTSVYICYTVIHTYTYTTHSHTRIQILHSHASVSFFSFCNGNTAK